MAFSDAQRAFLDQPLHAVVATRDPDGAISQSVVWFRRDGDTVWFSTRPTSAKVRHLRLDPEASFLALADKGGAYLRIEGTASLDEVVEPELRLALIGAYVGSDRAPEWIAAHPLPAPNTLVRLTPRRVVTYGLPG